MARLVLAVGGGTPGEFRALRRLFTPSHRPRRDPKVCLIAALMKDVSGWSYVQIAEAFNRKWGVRWEVTRDDVNGLRCKTAEVYVREGRHLRERFGGPVFKKAVQFLLLLEEVGLLPREPPPPHDPPDPADLVSPRGRPANRTRP